MSKEISTIAKIGRIINSSLDIEEVYEQFADEVQRLISFDRISINLINSIEYSTTIAHVAGLKVPGRLKGDIIPLPGTFSEKILRTRKSLLVSQDELKITRKELPGLLPSIHAGFRSLLSGPLISRDQVIGALHFRSTKEEAYSKKELQLAEQVGHQIAGAIANAQLFADHKRVAVALRESEKRFKDLYDNAPLGYQEYDMAGRITSINKTELEMLGYTAEEMIGQPVWKFIVGEEVARDQIRAKLAGALPPGRNLERIYQRKDGSTIPVLNEDRFIFGDEGKIKGIRCTVQDISEWKRVEKEMSGLQEQLRQSQKMEAIGQLAGGIAHDFNNLLTVIGGHSQISLHKLDNDQSPQKDIETIIKAAERAGKLTSQILAFSRKQIMEIKVLDLNSILQDLYTILQRVIGEDIEFVTLLAEDLWRVKTDLGQIEQVIINLSVNARDAMPKGGKLTIETANVELDNSYTQSHIAVDPGFYVMLSVSDTGFGMTPEVKKRVFEPFFTTKEKGQGTGLGLSMVYGIVKQSGGNIWIYSEPGQGTTFKIYFPRVDEPMCPEKKTPIEIMPRGDETILVVEDETAVRNLTVQILEGQGYTVISTSRGKGAISILEAHPEPIHLVITDVVMPEMNGYEVGKQLESLKPKVKVLYMSGYADDTIIHHGVLEKGANYIQKPFTPAVLARKVREALDK